MSDQDKAGGEELDMTFAKIRIDRDEEPEITAARLDEQLAKLGLPPEMSVQIREKVMFDIFMENLHEFTLREGVFVATMTLYLQALIVAGLSEEDARHVAMAEPPEDPEQREKYFETIACAIVEQFPEHLQGRFKARFGETCRARKALTDKDDAAVADIVRQVEVGDGEAKG